MSYNKLIEDLNYIEISLKHDFHLVNLKGLPLARLRV